MIYNLLRKEETPTWEESKNSLIKSINLNEDRIGSDYEKAFPYLYDEEKYFVVDGDLSRPFKVNSDLSIYFYTDEEQAILCYRPLRDGEIVVDDKLVIKGKPIGDYKWHQDTWIEEREYLILTNSITLETEKDKARVERGIVFTAYHNLLNNYNAQIVDLSEEEKEEIILWRAEWLDVPNNYINIVEDVSESYPETPSRIKYYL